MNYLTSIGTLLNFSQQSYLKILKKNAEMQANLVNMDDELINCCICLSGLDIALKLRMVCKHFHKMIDLEKLFNVQKYSLNLPKRKVLFGEYIVHIEKNLNKFHSIVFEWTKKSKRLTITKKNMHKNVEQTLVSFEFTHGIPYFSISLTSDTSTNPEYLSLTNNAPIFPHLSFGISFKKMDEIHKNKWIADLCNKKFLSKTSDSPQYIDAELKGLKNCHMLAFKDIFNMVINGNIYDSIKFVNKIIINKKQYLESIFNCKNLNCLVENVNLNTNLQYNNRNSVMWGNCCIDVFTTFTIYQDMSSRISKIKIS